jgi:tape measure domain-containing protein
MNGFTYLINVSVLGDNALVKLTESLERVERSIGHVVTNTGNTVTALQNMGQRGAASFDSITASATRLIARIGAVGLATQSLQGAARNDSMVRSINFASGGKEVGGENIAFLRKTVEELGTPLQASMEGFKTLAGSVMGTGISAEQTRNIFYSVSEASSVMGLGAQEAQGAFLALGQMASKGTVSAEELRGQLGERLPGAFNIAARSIGVTTAQLDKMLKDGAIAAKDFLPKFAAELHRTFSGGVMEAAQSATANFNRLNNAFLDLKITVGDKLLPAVLPFIHDFLIPAVHFLGNHLDQIITYGGALLGLSAVFKVATTTIAIFEGTLLATSSAFKVITLAQTVYMAVTMAATGGTWGMIAAMDALGLAFLLNPIGLVVIGIAALGAGLVYAYKHSETFRNVLHGVWEVLKLVGEWIGEKLVYEFQRIWFVAAPIFKFLGELIGILWHQMDKLWHLTAGMREVLWDLGSTALVFLIKKLEALANVLFGIFTMDFSHVKKGLMQGIGQMESDVLKGGEQLGMAFNKGFRRNMLLDVEKNWQEKEDRDNVYMTDMDRMSKYWQDKEDDSANNRIFKGTKAGGLGDSMQDKKIKNGMDNITGGGRTSKNITINIKELGSTTIHTTSVKEAHGDMKDAVMRAMTEVLNSANQVQ